MNFKRTDNREFLCSLVGLLITTWLISIIAGVIISHTNMDQDAQGGLAFILFLPCMFMWFGIGYGLEEILLEEEISYGY